MTTHRIRPAERRSAGRRRPRSTRAPDSPSTRGLDEPARRELEEETGLRAKNWRKLGEAYLSNSVSDEFAIWYVATGLTQGERRPEGTEQLEIRRVPLDDALRMTMSGDISDAISQLAIMQYHLASKKSL